MKRLIITLTVLLTSLLSTGQVSKGWETGDMLQGIFAPPSLAYTIYSGYPGGYSGQISTDYAREGTKSMRFEVRQSDSTVGSGIRAELAYSRLQPWADTLDKFAISILYPTGYAADREGELNVQMHQPGGGPPAWGVGTQNGKPYLYINYDLDGTGVKNQWVVDMTKVGTAAAVKGTGPVGTVIKAVPMVINAWNDWAFYYKRSTGANGIFRAYYAGELVFERYGPNYNKILSGGVLVDEGTCYLKFGCYKYPWNNGGTSDVSTRIVYVDAYKHGGPLTPMNAMFITTPNTPPTVSAGIVKQIKLPTTQVTLNGSASDNSSVKTLAWTKVSGPSLTITSSTTATTDVIVTSIGTYVLKLTATDDQGLASSDTTSIVVLAANLPPTVTVDPDKTVQLPTSLSVSGTANDLDGSIASTVWTKISGPNLTIDNSTSLTTTLSNFSNGTYKLRLTVTDNEGGTSFKELTIVVLPPNVSPVANAGIDRKITLPVNSLSQTGVATDADGSVYSTQWNQVSGPNNSLIVDQASLILTATNLIEGTYVFSFTVVDNQGASNVDNFTLVVDPAPLPPNVPPTANIIASQTNITLPTNSITLDGSNSTDTDDFIKTYNWSKLTGPTTYTIVNPNNSSTTIANLVAGTYSFQLTVTDSRGATGSNVVQIIVNPAIVPPNQTPFAVITSASPSITLPVDTITFFGNNSNDPDGSISKYAWAKVSGPNSITFSSITASSTTLKNLIAGTYIISLTVTDNQGATNTTTKQVIVNPVPPNKIPTANAGPDRSITLPIRSTTLLGSGTDQDGTITYRWDKISGPTTYIINNRTSATTSVYNLVKGKYVFRLTVTDNKGATAVDYVTVVVNKSTITILKTTTIYKNT